MFSNNLSIENPINYIQINGVISEDSFSSFLKEFCDIEMSNQPFIPVIINSFGGCASSSFAMVDIIEQSEKPVYTIINGAAYSGGALISVAGHKGCRYITPNSSFLVHEGFSIIGGKQTHINATNKFNNKQNKQVLQYMSKKCGKHKKYFQNILKKNKNVDLYYTAKQAKKLGAVDHIGYPKFSRVESFEISEKI